VFETLVRVGDGGILTPGLASRFEKLGAGGWKLALREGARFSDGTLVSDEDIAASLEIANSGFRLRREGDWLLLEPARAGLRAELLLTRSPVAHRTATGYIGTGPFSVVEEDDKHLLLRRNGPTPENRLDSIEIRAYDSPSDAFAHTLAGDADALIDLPIRMVEFFEGVPHLRVIRGGSPSVEAIVFDSRILGRPVREALARNIENSDLGSIASREGCDPRLARRTSSVPIPGGAPLDVLAINADALSQRLALGLRRALGTRAGAALAADAKDALSMMLADRTHLAIYKLLLWPRSVQIDHFHTGGNSNLGGYSNPVVDAALDRDDWAAAEKEMESDPPAVLLCSPERIAVVDARFKNARVGPYGFLETLPEWEASP
jgi:hypothetical protein